MNDYGTTAGGGDSSNAQTSLSKLYTHTYAYTIIINLLTYLLSLGPRVHS